MMTLNKRLVALAFGIVVAAAASPSYAQRHDGDEYRISAARAQALRECNARAAPYVNRDWGVIQGDIYRACMAEHGQME
jgi:hypothetical protein